MTRLLEMCCAALSALTTGDRDREITGACDAVNFGDADGLEHICGDPSCGFGDELPFCAEIVTEPLEDDRRSCNECRSSSFSEDEHSPD